MWTRTHKEFVAGTSWIVGHGILAFAFMLPSGGASNSNKAMVSTFELGAKDSRQATQIPRATLTARPAPFVSTPVESNLVPVSRMPRHQQEALAEEYASRHSERESRITLEPLRQSHLSELGNSYCFQDISKRNIVLDASGRQVKPGRYRVPITRANVSPQLLARAESFASLRSLDEQVFLFLAPEIELEMHRSLYAHLHHSGQRDLAPKTNYVASVQLNPVRFQWRQESGEVE